MRLLVVLVVGLIAGWLAGQIVQGTGFGIVAPRCHGQRAFREPFLCLLPPDLSLAGFGGCPIRGAQMQHTVVRISVLAPGEFSCRANSRRPGSSRRPTPAD
jgi:hypothetical protein